MMFFIQIFCSLALLLATYLAYVAWTLLDARKKCKWLPQAPRVPILGSIFEFGDHTETLNDVARLTNNPSKLSYIEVLGFWNIIVKDYDFMEFILTSNVVLDKSHDYKYLECWLGTGLLTSTGAKWKKRRRIITPAFHFSILEQFVDIFDTNCQVLVEKLDKEAAGKESVDIYEYVTACALDNISESAMGVNVNTQKGKNSDYVFAVKDMCKIVLNRAMSTWKRSNFLFLFSSDYRRQKKHLKVLHGFTNGVIERRRRDLERTSNQSKDKGEDDDFGRKKKMAFLDLLLNSTVDGQPLSQEDIREEVDTFMFEGHDTTSSGIASALFALANHLQIQEQVREEQKQLYGQDRDRATTYQDLQDMKYLEIVIKEVLRLYPPVPIIGRYIAEDVQFKGHTVPKGTLLTLNIYGINRDPDYFESPLEFRPERFMENMGKSPFAYIPFSAGPRNCIGQKFAILEMKSMISKVIRNFELFPTDPPHEMLLTNEAVLKSLNGVKIRLRRRSWDN